MRVLMLTTEYPTSARPSSGIFIVRQVEALRRAGVDVQLVSFRSAANMANHFRAWKVMRSAMQATPFDVVHAQFGHTGLVALAQRRLPVVMTLRGSDLLGIIGARGRNTWKGRLLVILTQFLSLMAKRVVVVSEAMGERLWRRDYRVIPSGVDLELFRPIPRDDARASLGWPQDRLIVLFAHVGWDSARKRVDLAQAALAIAAETIPVELRIASGVGPEVMPLYYNGADALLLTSVHEGSPNVVKEALACNLPVVSVDVGDVRARLSGVAPSAVCEPSPEALAAGLVQVLSPGRRSNGRETIACLSETVLAKQLIDVYVEVTRDAR